MTIGFNQVPNNIRVPGYYAEFNNRKANQGLLVVNSRALLIGQRLTTGAAPADFPVLVRDEQDAITLFGRGSMLQHMVKAFRLNDPYTELWAVPLNDNGSGVAATATLTVTGTPTANNSLSFYIGDYRVDVSVLSTDTANTLAARINTQINANGDLPVTSTVSTNVVTLTCRHRGLEFNDMRCEYNYFDEAAAPGVSIATTAFTGGTLNPDVTTAFSNLPDEIWDFIAYPYTDTTSLTRWDEEFGLSGRWSALQQLDGFGFAAKRGTVSALQTYGSSRNGVTLATLGYSGSYTSPWCVAAQWMGALAIPIANDPATPYTGIQIMGFAPPKPGVNRFNMSERNTLLYNGISTFTVRTDGACLVEQLCTMYQRNASNQLDPSWYKANTPLTLSYLRRSLRAWIFPKYYGYKLANDGTLFGAGQKVVTPKVIRGEVLAWFRAVEDLGLVEGYEQFERDLIVERDPNNPNRLNVLLPPDLVNQFDIAGFVFEFRV